MSAPPVPRAAPVPRTTPVTSSIDGRCHQVTDDAYTTGLTTRSGRYTALCGHRVLAAALVCPPGPDCWGCAATAAALTPHPVSRGRHRRGTHPGRHRRGTR